MSKKLFFNFCKIFIFLLLTVIIIVFGKKIYKKKLKFLHPLYGREIAKYDMSTIDIPNCKKDFKGNVWLISYSDGANVHLKNQRLLSASGLLNCIDRIILYRKRDIDKEFYQKNKIILDAKRGMGYWLWKPYFIFKTLSSIPNDDYLIYADSGVKLMRSANEMIEEFLIRPNKEMMFQYQQHRYTSSYKAHSKRIVAKFFKFDGNEELMNQPIMYNTITIIKNTRKTRDFYEKLLKYSCIPELIMDEPYGDDEYPEFQYHRHDGSLLTGFYLANKKKFDEFVNIVNSEYLSGNHVSYYHRREEWKSVNLTEYYDYMDKEKFAFQKVQKNF